MRACGTYQKSIFSHLICAGWIFHLFDMLSKFKCIHFGTLLIRTVALYDEIDEINRWCQDMDAEIEKQKKYQMLK